MVEAEGDVESRIAIPGAFGIEENRTGPAGQDVLRADVAVNQRARRCRGAVGPSLVPSDGVFLEPPESRVAGCGDNLPHPTAPVMQSWSSHFGS